MQVMNWPNYNIVVFQRRGRAKERERHGGMASGWSSQNTHNVYQLSLPSYMGMVPGAPKQL